MTVKFWKGNELCRVLICRSSLPATDVTGELGSLARFLSAVSTQPDVVACSGCHVDLVKTIDQSDYFPQGVQSCFRFEQLSLPTLIHKSKYSVFGQIDFFSVLQALMVSLGGCLTEEWALRRSKVSTPFSSSFLLVTEWVVSVQCDTVLNIEMGFYRQLPVASLTSGHFQFSVQSLSRNGNSSSGTWLNMPQYKEVKGFAAGLDLILSL